jgi:hypothetical protein
LAKADLGEGGPWRRRTLAKADLGEGEWGIIIGGRVGFYMNSR